MRILILFLCCWSVIMDLGKSYVQDEVTISESGLGGEYLSTLWQVPNITLAREYISNQIETMVSQTQRIIRKSSEVYDISIAVTYASSLEVLDSIRNETKESLDTIHILSHEAYEHTITKLNYIYIKSRLAGSKIGSYLEQYVSYLDKEVRVNYIKSQEIIIQSLSICEEVLSTVYASSVVNARKSAELLYSKYKIEKERIVNVLSSSIEWCKHELETTKTFAEDAIASLYLPWKEFHSTTGEFISGTYAFSIHRELTSPRYHPLDSSCFVDVRFFSSDGNETTFLSQFSTVDLSFTITPSLLVPRYLQAKISEMRVELSCKEGYVEPRESIITLKHKSIHNIISSVFSETERNLALPVYKLEFNAFPISHTTRFWRDLVFAVRQIIRTTRSYIKWFVLECIRGIGSVLFRTIQGCASVSLSSLLYNLILFAGLIAIIMQPFFLWKLYETK